MEFNQNINRTFKCYFCNKTIKNETEMGHTTICGNVLVPCPNNCGSYIPRMDLNKHKKECLNRISRAPRITSESETSETDMSINSSASYPENRSFSNAQQQVANFKTISDIYQRNPNVSVNLIKQELQSFKNDQRRCHYELQKLKMQNQELQEWKKNVETYLSSFKNQLVSYDKTRKETDLHWMHMQEKIMMLEKIQMDLNYHRDAFAKEQNFTRQCYGDNAKQLTEVHEYFSREITVFNALWKDHTEKIDDIKKEAQELNNLLSEQKAKYTNINFDVRALTQISSEATEKIEIQEKLFNDILKKFKQMQLDIQCLEDAPSKNTISNTPGHLLWKITDFDAKMEDAKDSGSVLKSPVFYTHDYGYKVRLYVYLNGLKKWKDRYALICLHVLKGDYDVLLKWPCHIEGNVVLKDLENIDNPKNYVKFITAKRQCGDEETEDPQESSSTYIFIPHSTMTKSKYIKDDNMFIEILIEQNRKLKLETNF